MLLRILIIKCWLLLSFTSQAKTILVTNMNELITANQQAKPGDVIILRNGEWNNVLLSLNCTGTKGLPITFKAETAGKVFMTGNSNLKLGGTYIIVDGLYFANGFAGNDAVIKFCIDKDQLANNCRVTNTVINDFNNPKRLEENYWVAFYGKNNRLDHCSFLNKKNLGVLLAVIMDDERSRESFHSIDHNYFGVRLPLASNAGEIIRVGVSQHCEFNSNTQITDNFFENCDGEAEIISIKSGHNVIRNNVFKECQGAVVLRHGDFNTIENNVFLGNNRKGTGGVRIINKGQWVVNNYFYQCLGTGFRSPLSIMNGVPNSPANRYVAVTDAVVANNSFIECAPISFCEGSDAERSVPPSKVHFKNNIFYNSKDPQLCNIYDDISGISFSGNLVSDVFNITIKSGFTKSFFTWNKAAQLPIPERIIHSSHSISDSLKLASRSRLTSSLPNKPGYGHLKRLQETKRDIFSTTGAKWYGNNNSQSVKEIKKDCRTAKEIEQLLAEHRNLDLVINLTGTEYVFNGPLIISNDVIITSNLKAIIKFSMQSYDADFFILLKAGKKLRITNVNLDLTSVGVGTFITTDTSGNGNHSNLIMNNCSITNLKANFFTAAKTSVSDSIIVNNCSFAKGAGVLFKLNNETDNRGYYNTEKIKITNSSVKDHKGQILVMLRGGKDESTMGPLLIFSNNKLYDCFSEKDEALLHIYGTQLSFIEKNSFMNCNKGRSLILFEDMVRAMHIFRNNRMTRSGQTILNKFVKSNDNIVI